MKRLVFSFLMALIALYSLAEDVNAIMLHLSSGNQVICLLDEKPVITFSGDDVKLTTHMNELTYPLAEVLKFTYMYVGTSGASNVGEMHSMFSFSGNSLYVTGAEPNSAISVCSIDGVLVASVKTGQDGSVNIVLPEYPGKVYIVKSSIAVFKIAKP